MTSTSLGEDRLVQEVRTALSDINQNLLSDDTIVQQHKRIVEPFLDRNTTSPDQTDFDNAAIMYTAEKAYKSIPQKSTISAGGVTANMAVSQYINVLEERSSEAFAPLGVVHPEKGKPAPFVKRTDGMFDDLR